MSILSTYVTGLGALLSAVVVYLGALFMFAPKRGLAFTTHKIENLPSVMSNRYFSMSAVMIGSLIYGKPEVIAFVFVAMGLSAAHDAWIYARAGQPYKKHIPPAVLSACVAGGAIIVYSNSGAV